MPSCREMADTDSPCRCKSKIITSSPSLITVPLLPPIGAASAMVRRLASPKRTLGTSGFIKTGEFSNAAFEENAPATHNYRGGCDCGNRFGLALVGQRHGAETALKVAKRLVASQQSAMSWR